MKTHNKKSKRQTLARKYNIAKKVKEHNRKAKKKARLAGRTGGAKRKLKKDPGIPNLWPFKAALLKEAGEHKSRLESKLEEAKKRRRLEQERRREANAAPLEDLVAKAAAQHAEFAEREAQRQEDMRNGIPDSTRRAYYRELKTVVETADVLLEVLDARDPFGTRCKAVENLVLNKYPEKRIVMVLNKIDLVPRENMEAWLKYMRAEFPSVAFKANTQAQRSRLGRGAGSAENATDAQLQGSECVGADTLLSLLKNYCRNENIKTAITVGVVGLPNVGKSSLINSLKRRKSVGVGSTPGLTKSVQEVALDKHIRLLDCPGVILSNSGSVADMALRNSVKLEQLDDPLQPVEAILKRCNAAQMMELYNVAAYETPAEFLESVGRASGKLLKGNKVDIDAAARLVLKDWNEGAIPYYTVPPDHRGKAQVVGEWGAEFSLDEVVRVESKELRALAGASANDGDAFMRVETGTEMDAHDGMADVGDEDEDEGEEEDGEGGVHVGGPSQFVITNTSNKRSKKQLKRQKEEESRAEAAGGDSDAEEPNAEVRRSRRRARKDSKKRKKSELEQAKNAHMDDDLYDFGRDYFGDDKDAMINREFAEALREEGDYGDAGDDGDSDSDMGNGDGESDSDMDM